MQTFEAITYAYDAITVCWVSLQFMTIRMINLK